MPLDKLRENGSGSDPITFAAVQPALVETALGLDTPSGKLIGNGVGEESTLVTVRAELVEAAAGLHRRGAAMPRRRWLAQMAAAIFTPWLAPMARAATPELGFKELYGKVGVLGLAFSQKAQGLKGKTVQMKGFMAPPLKAEAAFFVLTEIPMALCPFCSSDADWPDNIAVVYLGARQTFVQSNAPLLVSGKLEIGSWTDPETGFVSLVRLTDARFGPA